MGKEMGKDHFQTRREKNMTSLCGKDELNTALSVSVAKIPLLKHRQPEVSSCEEERFDLYLSSLRLMLSLHVGAIYPPDCETHPVGKSSITALTCGLPEKGCKNLS